MFNPFFSDQLLADENTVKNELNTQYQILYALQKKSENPMNKSEKFQLRKEYKSRLHEIKNLEKQHKKICLELTSTHKKVFLENRKVAAEQLDSLERDSQTLPKDDPKRQLIDTARLAFDAKNIYFPGDYKKANNAYEFQARYLLSNNRMGREVEWFCKSAEDRAGRTGEKIEEMLTFNEAYGRFPSRKNDQLMINQTISPAVHNASVNIEITNHNDPGARGLQASSKFGGQHLSLSEIDKPMARLAKNVPKIDSLKPSPSLIEDLKRPQKSTYVTPLIFDHKSGGKISTDQNFEIFSQRLKQDITSHTTHDLSACRVELDKATKKLSVYENSKKLFSASGSAAQTKVDFVPGDIMNKTAYLAVSASHSPITVSSRSLNDLEQIVTAKQMLNKELIYDERTTHYLEGLVSQGKIKQDIHPNLLADFTTFQASSHSIRPRTR